MKFIVVSFFILKVQAYLFTGRRFTSLIPECSDINSAIRRSSIGGEHHCHSLIHNLEIYQKQNTLYLCKSHWSYEKVGTDGIKDIINYGKKTGCGFYRVSKEQIVQCECFRNLYRDSSYQGYDYLEHLLVALIKIKQLDLK